MYNGPYSLEDMRADATPDEFLVPFGSSEITLFRQRLADHDGKICFSFPYVSWCSDMYLDADELVTICVED